MFKKKVLPKKKQLEITDGDTVLDIATYRYTPCYSYVVKGDTPLPSPQF